MQTATRTVARQVRPGFFTRRFTTTPLRKSTWTPGPSPPRLPKEEQEIFEKLQQQSTGAFSTPQQSLPDSTQQYNAAEGSSSTTTNDMLEQLRARARVSAEGDGEELHPNVRRGAAPEFQGDVNPKTGEVGGPKNDPLRWGVAGDWSYNGRVTDF